MWQFPQRPRSNTELYSKFKNHKHNTWSRYRIVRRRRYRHRYFNVLSFTISFPSFLRRHSLVQLLFVCIFFNSYKLTSPFSTKNLFLFLMPLYTATVDPLSSGKCWCFVKAALSFRRSSCYADFWVPRWRHGVFRLNYRRVTSSLTVTQVLSVYKYLRYFIVIIFLLLNIVHVV